MEWLLDADGVRVLPSKLQSSFQVICNKSYVMQLLEKMPDEMVQLGNHQRLVCHACHDAAF
ncbi:hypothetical protein T4D_5951 [Trichinella pseudospiralis]|uniref:Uncharacterized protein n=1 Tax=Trichinella pseudospiralis TaxID=6337 RepID=A0A0V1F3Y9_TRIPS|nr:hypothetical protein T4D_5951 [Trichinella pseudospiralis]